MKGAAVRFGLELGGGRMLTVGRGTAESKCGVAWMIGLGGKALGSVSCPHPCKSWLFLAFQWPRGCS